MTHYSLTVPITYSEDGTQKRRYTRVGTMFENTRKETGQIYYSIKFDFPVAVDELLAFPLGERPEERAEERAGDHINNHINNKGGAEENHRQGAS